MKNKNFIFSKKDLEEGVIDDQVDFDEMYKNSVDIYKEIDINPEVVLAICELLDYGICPEQFESFLKFKKLTNYEPILFFTSLARNPQKEDNLKKMEQAEDLSESWGFLSVIFWTMYQTGIPLTETIRRILESMAENQISFASAIKDDFNIENCTDLKWKFSEKYSLVFDYSDAKTFFNATYKSSQGSEG